MSRNIFSSQRKIEANKQHHQQHPLSLWWRTLREASLEMRLRWSPEWSLCMMLTANSRSCSEVPSVKSKRTALFRQSSVWKLLKHFPWEFQKHFLLSAQYFNELILASSKKEKNPRYHRWIGVSKEIPTPLNKEERQWCFMGKDLLAMAGESPNRNTFSPRAVV